MRRRERKEGRREGGEGRERGREGRGHLHAQKLLA